MGSTKTINVISTLPSARPYPSIGKPANSTCSASPSSSQPTRVFLSRCLAYMACPHQQATRNHVQWDGSPLPRCLPPNAHRLDLWSNITSLEKPTSLPNLEQIDQCSKGHICAYWYVRVHCFYGKDLCLYACLRAHGHGCTHVSEFMCVRVQECSMCVYLCMCIRVCARVAVFAFIGTPVSTYGYVFCGCSWKVMQVVSCQLQNWPQPPSPLKKHSVFSFLPVSETLHWKHCLKTGGSACQGLGVDGARSRQWLLMGTGFLSEVIRCSQNI